MVKTVARSLVAKVDCISCCLACQYAFDPVMFAAWRSMRLTSAEASRPPFRSIEFKVIDGECSTAFVMLDVHVRLG